MKNITIIFPSIFGEICSPWDVEYKIAKEVGFNVGIIDEIDFKITGKIENSLVIYRGWMISFENYSKVINNIKEKKGIPFISKEIFKKSNSFSAWYYRLPKYTMKSYFIKEDEKFIDNVYTFFESNDSYFIKDNLKSLGEGKSIASSAEEAIEIYEKIKSNRDFKIENNGLCLRKVVSLENEERFFVLKGEVLFIGKTYTDKRLTLVKKIAKILLEKAGIFACSIDIASTEEKDVLVEVGGFQVTDIEKNGDTFIIRNFYESFYKEINKEFLK